MSRSTSRSFDIKLDQISEFYQAFNIRAVQVYESSKMIAGNFLIFGGGHALHENSKCYFFLKAHNI